MARSGFFAYDAAFRRRIEASLETARDLLNLDLAGLGGVSKEGDVNHERTPNHFWSPFTLQQVVQLDRDGWCDVPVRTLFDDID